VSDAKIRTEAQRDRLGKRRQPYYVAGVRGAWSLGLRKHKTTRLWVVRVRLGSGRYKQQTVGTADTGPDSLEYRQAYQAASEAAQAIQAGAATDGRLTVERAARDYLADLGNRGGDTGTAELHLSRFLPAFGAELVADLDAKSLSTWRNKLPAQPPRARTSRAAAKQNRRAADLTDPEVKRRRRASANRIMNTARAVLNRAARLDNLPNAHAWKHGLQPFPKTNAPRVAWFSQAEAERFLNACQPGFRELAAAALLTGCRLGELQRLKAKHLDVERAALFIERTKSGGARTVHLNAAGADFFERLATGKRPGDLLLTRPKGEPWGKSHHTRPMRKACEAAGVEPMPFHCLRHTYASLSVKSAASLQVVAANLGHTSTRMTERHYAHLADEYLREQIAKSAPSFSVELPTDQVAPIDKAKRRKPKRKATG